MLHIYTGDDHEKSPNFYHAPTGATTALVCDIALKTSPTRSSLLSLPLLLHPPRVSPEKKILITRGNGRSHSWPPSIYQMKKPGAVYLRAASINGT